MRAQMRCGLPTFFLVLLVLLPADAADPAFADLLAQAQAQAAAGHRWAPPGDNFAETVITMVDRLSTATPAQIAEFTALVERNHLASLEAPASTAAPPDAPPGSVVVRPDAAVAPLAPVPPLVSSPAPSPVPSRPTVPPPAAVAVIPDSHTNDLYVRGQAAERRGDISGARRFYASAAQHGHAAAARNLGRLYDPAFLTRNSIGGIDADPAAARYWYERATALGDAAATPLLQALSTR